MVSGVGNILISVFGGQPLAIMVVSKSTLVFDKILYNYTSSHNLPFLAFRFWIGFWAFLMLLLLVATNASGILLILTRFTLELFSVVLSIVFIVYVVVKFWDIHHGYIGSNFFDYNRIDGDCLCYHRVLNSTDNSSLWERTDSVNCTEGFGDEEFRCLRGDCDEVLSFSIILLLGTFLVAWYLKRFYYTPFLTSLVSTAIF